MPRPPKKSPPARSPKKIKKSCYACKTERTPYWREGWKKGIILCNACGLRFSKYKKFCAKCNAIGVKAHFDRVTCPKCEEKLD